MAEAVKAAPLRVLRICSVFEPPDDALSGSGARFDPIGGMQNHTGQLTRALDVLGVRQDVITHRPPGSAPTQLFARRAVVHRFGLPVPWARQLYSTPAAIAAWRLAARVDLVHAHLGEDLAVLPIAVAAARRRALPLVVTIHTSLRHTLTGSGPRVWLLRSVGGWIETRVCRVADAIIALTPRLASCLTADGVDRERVHVIPPGVNGAEFPADPTDPFPAIGHPRIVFVGRLGDQKGVDVLIEAIARMRMRAQVLIVGDGPKRAEIETAVRRHALADRVHITGFCAHREIPAILHHAAVFCLPSRYEELSSALLEAMRAGRPIVATAVGGVPEALGPAGRLVPPEDAAALARALDALLASPTEAARLGELAGQRAHAYEWSTLAAAILDVYHTATRQHSRAANLQPRSSPPPA